MEKCIVAGLVLKARFFRSKKLVLDAKMPADKETHVQPILCLDNTEVYGPIKFEEIAVLSN